MSKNFNQDYRDVRCNLCGEKCANVYAVNESNNEKVLHHVRVQCRKCGLIYSNPEATETKMAQFYSEMYPEILRVEAPEKLRAMKGTYDETFFLDASDRKKQMKPGRFLDVGSSYGMRVKTAELLGWEAYGVEVSTVFCDYAKNNLGLKNIFNGSLLEAKYKSSFFDYVILWHVLEHVSDPMSLLKEIERILKIGGVLLIGVPNVLEPLYQMTRIACKIKGRSWPMATSDHHTYEFTPSTLQKILNKASPRLRV